MARYKRYDYSQEAGHPPQKRQLNVSRAKGVTVKNFHDGMLFFLLAFKLLMYRFHISVPGAPFLTHILITCLMIHACTAVAWAQSSIPNITYMGEERVSHWAIHAQSWLIVRPLNNGPGYEAEPYSLTRTYEGTFELRMKYEGEGKWRGNITGTGHASQNARAYRVRSFVLTFCSGYATFSP